MRRISIYVLVLLLLVGCTVTTASESGVFEEEPFQKQRQLSEDIVVETTTSEKPIVDYYDEELMYYHTVMIPFPMEVPKQVESLKTENQVAGVTQDLEESSKETTTSEKSVDKPKEQPVKVEKKEEPKPVIQKKSEKQTEKISFKTIHQNDDSLEKGKTVVKQAGTEGVRTLVYELTFTDGRQTSRTLISSSVTKSPQNRVILIGTKEPPKETIPIEPKPVETKPEEPKPVETKPEEPKPEPPKPVEPKPEEPKPEEPKPVVTDDQAFINEVIRLTNLERTKRGLKALKSNLSGLNQAANVRAREITRVFSHTRPNGTPWSTTLAEWGLPKFSARGENILWNGAQWTPAKVVEKWMNSTGHRNNILSTKYEYIGVGFARIGNKDGVSQLFYKP